MDGVLNIYKEKGYTSHDVVAVVRKTIGIKKVGHTGTLDPNAEGVLPICVGRATKLADYIMAAKKQYRAEITFGITTTTEDSSGEIIEEKEFLFDEEKIKEAVKNFIGEIKQIPPMYSAIKVGGKKLYELARDGKEIERKSRLITVYDIQILSLTSPNKAEILVNCSKGTYIRTLCKDIGAFLGWGAHMSDLTRTRSGNFTLEETIKLGRLKELAENSEANKVLLPMEKALKDYNRIIVDEKSDKYLKNGCKIYEPHFKKADSAYALEDIVAAYDSSEALVGLFKITKDENKICMKPIKILWN